jgi:hypothetical protein
MRALLAVLGVAMAVPLAAFGAGTTTDTGEGNLAAITGLADRMVGKWRVEPNAGATVKAAIEETVAPMNGLFRYVARKKLAKRFPAAEVVEIVRRRQTLEILLPNETAAPLPLSGEVVSVEDRTYQLRITNNRLCRYGTSPEGTRTLAFVISDTPRELVIETTVTSPRLPRPLHFRLRYTPAAAR